MQLTATGIAIFYGLVGVAGAAFIIWLCVEIVRLLRTPDAAKPPED